MAAVDVQRLSKGRISRAEFAAAAAEAAGQLQGGTATSPRGQAAAVGKKDAMAINAARERYLSRKQSEGKGAVAKK